MKTPIQIFGSGASGVAAAKLLAEEGLHGVVYAERAPSRADQATLASLGFPWNEGDPPAGAGTVVVSPGLPADHPWIAAAAAGEADLLPEYALGASRLKGSVLAVTGSLGKTTMVTFAADLLRTAGLRVTLSGNMGVPVCTVARAHPSADVHVMELSSFQTEINPGFRPDAGVWLNLFPNHLDRHETLEAYAAAKARMFVYQTPEDLAVLPPDLPVAVETSARKVAPDPGRVPETSGTRFDTPALRANLAALLTGLSPWDVDPQMVRQVMETFPFPPHRMEPLEFPGLGLVIDDSKSTCLAATRAALESVPGTVHLVAGGLPKGEDYHEMRDLLAKRRPRLYLYGNAAPKMREAWEDLVPVCEAGVRLQEALEAVFSRRHADEPLLFSPGCASFDQYSGYVERGQHFRRLLQEMQLKNSQTEFEKEKP